MNADTVRNENEMIIKIEELDDKIAPSSSSSFLN
jgi:hypothetical protein